MMEAGRIKHHLANNISDPRNTILAVGYCAPSSLGSRLLSGEKIISIFGEKHLVRAKIEMIEAFSGHGDYQEMMAFLSCQDKNLLKKVFLVHGDYPVQQFYGRELNKAGFHNIEIPEQGETFAL
jgi:metallo-beta-lactamase family protein